MVVEMRSIFFARIPFYILVRRVPTEYLASWSIRRWYDFIGRERSLLESSILSVGGERIKIHQRLVEEIIKSSKRESGNGP